LARYEVNVLIDNGELPGAPVVVERNPTYYNLIGRQDYRTVMGTVETDFRQITAGAMHRANGGFLVLQAQYAQDWPLSLGATITFEQSYGGIDGDSASTTELYALLSALSGLPLNQGIAVTGAVNQHGEVQAVGGVTRKIEGFYDVCRERGLTGGQACWCRRPTSRT
jgi:predicted ATP-dependent protease